MTDYPVPGPLDLENYNLIYSTILSNKSFLMKKNKCYACICMNKWTKEGIECFVKEKCYIMGELTLALLFNPFEVGI